MSKMDGEEKFKQKNMNGNWELFKNIFLHAPNAGWSTGNQPNHREIGRKIITLAAQLFSWVTGNGRRHPLELSVPEPRSMVLPLSKECDSGEMKTSSI